MTAPFGYRGRANTVQAKRLVMSRLLRAWMRSPYQRLGQLLDNAIPPSKTFFIEDEELVKTVEKFVEENPS